MLAIVGKEQGAQSPAREENSVGEPGQALLEYKWYADASMTPMNLTAGAAHVYDVPVEGGGKATLFAHGFGVMKPRYRSMFEISRTGRRLIAIHPATRYGGTIEHFDNHFPEDVRRARQITEVLERKEIRNADLIGKSGGAAGSLIAAILRPDLIDTVVLLNPNGMIKDRPHKVSGRFLRKVTRTKRVAFPNNHPGVDLRFRDAGSELLKTLFANPKRTIDEIVALGNTDLNGLMRRARDKGVMVSIVAAAGDELFPLDRIFGRMRELQEQGEDHKPFVGFYVIRGGHDDLAGDPARMRLCLNALDNMQALRDKNAFGEHISS